MQIFAVINTIVFIIYRFFRLYRMPKDVFMEVFKEVENLLEVGQRRSRLDPLLRFAVTIAFYATGAYQTNVYQDRISQASASNCINEVTDALASCLPRKWIRFPTTMAERDIIKAQFFKKFGVPGIIGSIDCTHVNIIAPNEAEHIFVDRKQNHSMNVQLVSFFFFLFHPYNEFVSYIIMVYIFIYRFATTIFAY